MKRTIAALSLSAAILVSLTACSAGNTSQQTDGSTQSPESLLQLSDDEITLDGTPVTSSQEGAVTVGHDIVCYQAGMGSDYGEGSEADAHTLEEAEVHTVVTIRQPGTYRVSGTLSAGQLAVDLGDGARTDPDAVVTLILDGVDITCTVAPAVIFYQVYECDTDWVSYSGPEGDYEAVPSVDTTQAGANVILADGSENDITGSYVARIYQEGTTETLHKYDGAFYSKMSMNIKGEEEGTGVLNIEGENEGLDSELHLTINGGTINIKAQNDGSNTNEDGVSVTTINGGTVQINAGLGEEGDGIDSNGFLVINGGYVYTMSNDRCPDGGLDADRDILINGGYVVALGVRNDGVSEDSLQEYMELSFASALPAGSELQITDEDGEPLLSFTTEKACQSLIFSSPDLVQDTDYTVTVNGEVQAYTGYAAGQPGGQPGGHGEEGQRPQPPEGDSQPPEPPQDDAQRPDLPPEEAQQSGGERDSMVQGDTRFTLTEDRHAFSGVSDSAESGEQANDTK